MKLWKKVILTVLGLVLISVAGFCAYGIKMYSDATYTVKGVYESIDRTSKRREAAVNIDAQEPFSVLLMGIDTGDLGRTEQGRSDTTMVVTINPKEKKSTMISLDRDILTEIVGNGTEDKLNHAYAFGGAKMAIDTVSELLDIPIDNYVSINMKGLKDLIDAVGGIEVDNTLGEFTLDGIVVPAGKITLDGETGLAYARMRKEDPDGDIGRQRRQREVVEKIVNKIISLDGLTKYRKILDAVKDNVKTDLTWDNMVDIQKKYMPAFKNIDSLQLDGEGTEIDSIYYQLLDPTKLYETQTELRAQLGMAKNEEMQARDTSNYNNYAGGNTAAYGGTSTDTTNYSYDPNTYVDPNTGVVDSTYTNQEEAVYPDNGY
ncbi:LytR family transcriptional regulator [Enterococcus ureilyticus]|uniref:LytR family transcriptional regulator n=1 Tax=Enterococcus ureilyticus TaxID=1131292 RepID=A0A1E5HFN5_9ENTE|nr:LCP family protein [Enterococcus ureilyticus]MBM7689348.1 LCP family protein required for cell wall assembly [Enterococcus ureilyticus]MBO0446598.1 LCP family protein [Enterococcus ureilyticus]OEG23615.1 LytR family transcriptional regulator [Enterococcus ureilyticus]